MSGKLEGKLETATAEMVELSAKYYKDLKKAGVTDQLACKLVRDFHLCLWQDFIKRSGEAYYRKSQGGLL